MTGAPVDSAWSRVLDADLNQLLEIQLESRSPFLIGAYVDGMIAYLRGTRDELEGALTRVHGDDPPSALVRSWLGLRRWIRFGVPPTAVLFARSALGVYGRGETRFILGLLRESQGYPLPARTNFWSASRLLHRSGVRQKALRAELNAWVSDSQILGTSSERRLQGYADVEVRAREVGAFSVAASASLNLSREYLALGAGVLALEHAKRAWESSRSEQGTRNYFFSVANYARCLSALGRAKEADYLLEELRHGPFEDLRALADAFDARSPGQRELPAAVLRFLENPIPKKTDLGVLECRLLELLSTGPRSRTELRKLLASDVADEASALRLVDNTFYRLRKKVALDLLRPGR